MVGIKGYVFELFEGAIGVSGREEDLARGGAEKNVDAFTRCALRWWNWNTAMMPGTSGHRHPFPRLLCSAPPFSEGYKLFIIKDLQKREEAPAEVQRRGENGRRVLPIRGSGVDTPFRSEGSFRGRG